jgi:hypothetical protein
MNRAVVRDTSETIATNVAAAPAFSGVSLTALNAKRTALAAKITALENAQAAVDAALIEAENAAADCGDELATVGDACEAVTKDPATLRALGWELRGAPTPSIMVQVTNLRATMGSEDGSADLVWDPQKGALFKTQSSPDVTPRVWQDEEPTKDSKITVRGKPPGKRWWRVCAKGAHNTGPWSDPALCTIG